MSKTQAHVEKVLFKSTDGLTLSGDIHHPDSPPRGTAIIAHPHPLYGGNKDNNVVETLWRALPEDGFLTFRFNFRGVGASEGGFEEGIGETHDLKGAVQFLKDTGYANLPCFLTGYSFGAYVIHLLDTLPNSVKGIIMVSPPVSMSVFEANRFKACPTLFVTGDRDLFCRVEYLEKLVNHLKGDISLKVIPGIDHFWFGKEKTLVDTIRPWIESCLKGAS